MYICVYIICIYIYLHIYTHTHTYSECEAHTHEGVNALDPPAGRGIQIWTKAGFRSNSG